MTSGAGPGADRKPGWLRAALLSIAFAAGACQGGNDPVSTSASLPSFESRSEASWKALAGKTVCFGHQSVGGNILAGVEDVMKENPSVRLSVREAAGTEVVAAQGLVHFRVGKNVDPASKIAHFAEFVDAGGGRHADIAFFKFCYVDVTDKTDVAALFDKYKTTMKALEERHPGIRFVHVTVPLTVSRVGLKTRIKQLLGTGDLWEIKDNVKRNAFNDALLKEYSGKEPVFDLAAAEAAGPGGTASFAFGGKPRLSLAPEFSRDGGHLNEAGRKAVAKRFLAFLAGLADGGK